MVQEQKKLKSSKIKINSPPIFKEFYNSLF